MAHSHFRSPRTGDLVSAIRDGRDALDVEGILYLRYVPSLNYVQVKVITPERELSAVPDSVRVVRQEATPIDVLERGDPVVGEPGWRRIVDLAQAVREGLLPPHIEREGGSWDDLFGELHLRARPMLDAGWTLVWTDRDESWEYGDSVFYDLERDGATVELEYYEHGQLVAYAIDRVDESDAGNSEDVLFVIAESTIESAREAFQEEGWI